MNLLNTASLDLSTDDGKFTIHKIVKSLSEDRQLEFQDDFFYIQCFVDNRQDTRKCLYINNMEHRSFIENDLYPYLFNVVARNRQDDLFEEEVNNFFIKYYKKSDMINFVNLLQNTMLANIIPENDLIMDIQTADLK